MEIESPYLVDSHCHLNFKDFEEDFDSVIQRAKDSLMSKLWYQFQRN